MWYHGTPVNFDRFSDRFIGLGNDALGSGFYFTDNFETARAYALKATDKIDIEPVVFEVDLEIRKPLPEARALTSRMIEKLITSAPEYRESLMNFGDVAWFGEGKVLREAVTTYTAIARENSLQTLYALNNDFYRHHDALFLRNVMKLTGFDGVVQKVGLENHAVAWVPEQIRILAREFVQAEPAPSF